MAWVILPVIIVLWEKPVCLHVLGIMQRVPGWGRLSSSVLDLFPVTASMIVGSSLPGLLCWLGAQVLRCWEWQVLLSPENCPPLSLSCHCDITPESHSLQAEKYILTHGS